LPEIAAVYRARLAAMQKQLDRCCSSKERLARRPNDPLAQAVVDDNTDEVRSPTATPTPTPTQECGQRAVWLGSASVGRGQTARGRARPTHTRARATHRHAHLSAPLSDWPHPPTR